MRTLPVAPPAADLDRSGDAAQGPVLSDLLEGVAGDKVVQGRHDRLLEVCLRGGAGLQPALERRDEPEPEPQERVRDGIEDLLAGGVGDRVAAPDEAHLL